MAGLWWDAAVALICLGTLLAWGARALAVDDFYRDACLALALALICAGLGVAAAS